LEIKPNAEEDIVSRFADVVEANEGDEESPTKITRHKKLAFPQKEDMLGLEDDEEDFLSDLELERFDKFKNNLSKLNIGQEKNYEKQLGLVKSKTFSRYNKNKPKMVDARKQKSHKQIQNDFQIVEDISPDESSSDLSISFDEEEKKENNP
jgi:hypothetical protein